MLTQTINTSAPIGRKVAPAPSMTPDRFGVLTGHAGPVRSKPQARRDPRGG